MFTGEYKSNENSDLRKFFSFEHICFSSCAPLSIFNAGTVHVKYIESRAKFYGVKYREKARLTDPSVSIRNVQHPKVFGNWDLNFTSHSLHSLRRHYLRIRGLDGTPASQW